jgi:hypothetical protein
MLGYTVFVDVEVEHWFVCGGKETDKVGVSVIFEEIDLAGFIDCEDTRPYEYQRGF